MRQLKKIFILIVIPFTILFCLEECMTTFFQCHSFHFEHAQGLPEGTNNISSIGVDHGELVVLDPIYPNLDIPSFSLTYFNHNDFNYSPQYVSSLWLPPKVSLYNV